MKTIVYRSMAAVLLCVFALGVAAQGVLKVKVTNIPSAVGKLYAFHDETVIISWIRKTEFRLSIARWRMWR